MSILFPSGVRFLSRAAVLTGLIITTADLQPGDFFRRFFNWYKVQHLHSDIALLTPEDIHLGRVVERRKARQSVLLKAWQAHPERFVRGTPRPPELEPIYVHQPFRGRRSRRSHPWSRTY